ncbi:MAG: M61 family peptidase [Thermoanaerobaculia bacterium]
MPTSGLRRFSFGLLVAGLIASPLSAAPLKLSVDARDAARKILHLRLETEAKAGEFTLLYPKWIPGEHGPSGPIANLVNLRIEGGGKTLPWHRDPLEMYAVGIDVPPGVTSVVATSDFLYAGEGGSFSSGPSASDELAILTWNQVVLYPKGASGDDIQVEATIEIPAGWDFGTAMPVAERTGNRIRFAPVSLTTLVDSPVLIGSHLTTVELGTHGTAPHRITIAGDSAAAIAPAAEYAAGLGRLADEAFAIFGAQHFRSYRWLLSLSDHVQHFGLEHHESSDNRREERTLLDEWGPRTLSGLLAHEFMHSWNGKYRRPEGLLSPDFQRPMQGELLWVYEGLTEFLGHILPARSGLWTADYARENLALVGATLDTQTGRTWRPLADTGVAAQILYIVPEEWQTARRSTDFYDESTLIWLEVDGVLRAQSQGRVTIDDFCHRFHGGTSGAPAVVPYSLATVIGDLNALVPYDWQKFFTEHVYEVRPRAPLAGLESHGWKLVYSDAPNAVQSDSEKRRERRSYRFSVGFDVDKEGTIIDGRPDGAGFRAGLAPGMKILGVGRRTFSNEHFDEALTAARGSKEPIEFVVQWGEEVRVIRVDYHDGLRYPHLEAIAGSTDTLAAVLAAHAKSS